jgi:ribonuclease P protein component
MGGALVMLRSQRDFATLQGGGRSRAHPLIIVRCRRNELDHHRFGISTGRKVGGAVVRNRVRRRIREALRRMDRSPGVGWDILVVARPASAEASYPELKAALERVIGSMIAVEGTSGT